MNLFMKSLFAALLVGAVGALPITPAMAHEGAPIRGRSVSPPASVPTTLNFQLQQYFKTHPQILQVLAKDPSLINKPRFLKRHGRLAAILASHTRLQREFRENPKSMVNKYRIGSRTEKTGNSLKPATDGGSTASSPHTSNSGATGGHGTWAH